MFSTGILARPAIIPEVVFIACAAIKSSYRFSFYAFIVCHFPLLPLTAATILFNAALILNTCRNIIIGTFNTSSWICKAIYFVKCLLIINPLSEYNFVPIKNKNTTNNHLDHVFLKNKIRNFHSIWKQYRLQSNNIMFTHWNKNTVN